MSSENETQDEIELLSPAVVTPPRSVQPPIDYIDLTQDSPMALRLRSNGPVTRLISLSTELKRRRMIKQSTGLAPYKAIDHNDSAQSSRVHCTNDSIGDESVDLMCPVCLERLSSKLKPTATRCGHVFCEGCLQNAARQTKKCPLCQTRITLKSFLRLYF